MILIELMASALNYLEEHPRVAVAAFLVLYITSSTLEYNDLNRG